MNWGIKVETEATEQAMSRQEVKDYLKYDLPDEDTYIDVLRLGVMKRCEDWIRQPLIDTEFELTLDSLPGLPAYMVQCRPNQSIQQSYASGVIKLPMGRVSEVASIEYKDPTTGVYTTWASTEWDLLSSRIPAEIRPKHGKSFPTSQGGHEDWRIIFTAGFGADATKVPNEIKLGCLAMIASLFQTRGVIIVGTIVSKMPLPLSVQSLWASHKVQRWKYFD